MSAKARVPVTLGDALASKQHRPKLGPAPTPPISPIRIFLGALGGGLLVGLWSANLVLGLAAMILAATMLFFIRRNKKTVSSNKRKSDSSLLLSCDKQNFIKDLRLDQKTALFDGSNIFHFGIKNGIGATALWALANSLRSEGYRIVCFFDANIFFTLRENGELQNRHKRFSVTMLKEMFDLQPDEIYVVPSGSQADGYIIETLAVLPISFVVTNDRFRDYQRAHAFLAKDNQWRKGVEVKDGELRLFQHKFKRGLKV